VKLTIRQKFLGVTSFLLLALAGLSLFLLYQISQVNGELERMYRKDFSEAAVVAEIDGLLTRVTINNLRMIAIGDETSIARWRRQNEERLGKVEEALDKLRAGATGAQLATVGGLQENYRKLRATMERQMQAAASDDMDGAADITRTETREIADRTYGGLADLRQALAAAAKGRYEQQQAMARATFYTAAGAVLLVSCLALGIALLVVRNLLAQLGGEPDAAAAVAGSIADGDLSVAVPVRQGDHASLMAAMQSMRDGLARIVGEVHGGTAAITSASEQIASGNMDLSARTEEQASALEEAASSIEELTSTVQQNADNAAQANQLAAAASDVAVQGGTVVSQVVQTMGSINESARRIADITGVIDGIAFQTNILALNAAVEAARAGEQGRGFAVVAAEVRTLAQRSSVAAKEIKALIGESAVQVEAGSRLVDKAGQTMDQIVASVRQVSSLIAEIAAASREQSAGIAQVNTTVAQMEQVVQQNASLVEEGAAATEALKEQAATLLETVSRFRLGNHDRGALAAHAASPAPAPALPATAPMPIQVRPSPRLPPLATSAARPAARVTEGQWREF